MEKETIGVKYTLVWWCMWSGTATSMWVAGDLFQFTYLSWSHNLDHHNVVTLVTVNVEKGKWPILLAYF